ncbi:ArfGap-domain-containing protein [Cubamyces sp. BRFM 1775]|nr:ArfGap-domain-containing protein [Cubamyces sp. BRFM 1775]
MSQTVNKITAERNQRTLLELASQPGNDVCADCKTRNPRWASYNLGIFICVSCASIHRKMGTHISKVKSLTLDSWSKEQVEFMKSMGNIKSNAHYNPDEIRNPPPTNMIESERDSDLEKYIRSKYEYKSFRPRTAKVAELLGPSRSAASRAPVEPPRSKTVPVPTQSTSTSATITAARPAPAIAPSSSTASNASQTQSQFRSVSQPVGPSQTQVQQPAQQQQQALPQQSSNPLWNDLAQLQAPATNSSLPLQYASPATTQPISIPTMSTGLTAPSAYSGLSVSPNSPFPSSLQQHSPGGMFPGGQPRSMSLNTGLAVNAGGMGYGTGTSPGMMGTSPMLHPQPTLGGGLSAPMSMLPQNTTPSPSPFAPQSLPQAGYGMQQQPLQTGASAFAPSPFGQQQQNQAFLQSQPQGSPMFNPSQQLPYGAGSSPMFQSQPLGAGQGQMPMQQQMQGMSMGNSYLQPHQPQQQYGSPQPPFMGAPSPVPFGQPAGAFQQQPQQQLYGQGSAFGGTGWQPQQQWGGM